MEGIFWVSKLFKLTEWGSDNNYNFNNNNNNHDDIYSAVIYDDEDDEVIWTVRSVDIVH